VFGLYLLALVPVTLGQAITLWQVWRMHVWQGEVLAGHAASASYFRVRVDLEMYLGILVFLTGYWSVGLAIALLIVCVILFARSDRRGRAAIAVFAILLIALTALPWLTVWTPSPPAGFGPVESIDRPAQVLGCLLGLASVLVWIAIRFLRPIARQDIKVGDAPAGGSPTARTDH
jgi:peptidoglycan/LPS O-acetylase OafA/YrhL